MIGPGGKTLEVQIRTEAMHRQAEYGVAAHWQLQGSGKPSRRRRRFEQKIAWLRELLAWRDEVADWQSTAKQAQLDDTVYVLTPQGKVIDLPAGSTPVDFAYALHTDLGHRCRGARVDGQIVHARHAARERPARRDHRRKERRAVARLAERRARLREEHRARGQRSASGSTRRTR